MDLITFIGWFAIGWAIGAIIVFARSDR